MGKPSVHVEHGPSNGNVQRKRGNNDWGLDRDYSRHRDAKARAKAKRARKQRKRR